MENEYNIGKQNDEVLSFCKSKDVICGHYKLRWVTHERALACAIAYSIDGVLVIMSSYVVVAIYE